MCSTIPSGWIYKSSHARSGRCYGAKGRIEVGMGYQDWDLRFENWGLRIEDWGLRNWEIEKLRKKINSIFGWDKNSKLNYQRSPHTTGGKIPKTKLKLLHRPSKPIVLTNRFVFFALSLEPFPLFSQNSKLNTQN